MTEVTSLDLNSLKEDEDTIFDKNVIAEVEATETPPHPFSEEWHDYVIRQFRDDELQGGHPIRDGLERVAQKLIGPIVSKQITGNIGPNKDNYGTATVSVSLKFIVKNEQHPLIDDYLIQDGIADVNSRNTPHPFNLHASSTAASKAESQALRKALGLRKLVAAEELAPDDAAIEDVFLPDSVISNEQINIIDLLCRRTNLSVLEFINIGEIKYAFVKQIPSSKAQNMIKLLNEIQSGKKTVTIKPYDPAWRVKEEQRINNESQT